MKRGEIWTVSAAGDYSGKPRPAVIVQDDRFTNDIESVTICFCTSNTATIASPVRPEVAPNEANGLCVPSRLMADKISTVLKAKLGYRIGRLADEDIARLNRAMVVFLGIAASSSKPR